MGVSMEPVGGTFTVNFGHGTSDPLPYNANAESVYVASEQAHARDAEIRAQHRRDPVKASVCAVCNPASKDEIRGTDTWWERRIEYPIVNALAEVYDRLWYAKEALMGRYRG